MKIRKCNHVVQIKNSPVETEGIFYHFLDRTIVNLYKDSSFEADSEHKVMSGTEFLSDSD